nr:MAG TPA: hypothetical protein [Caudoviricetes sp.]
MIPVISDTISRISFSRLSRCSWAFFFFLPIRFTFLY